MLSELVLAAMVAFVDPGSHRYLEKPEITRARYVAIAEDIAAVVEAADGERVRDVETEALLLAAIASYEGFFRADVDSCRVGRSGAWSLWQIAGGGERRKANVCGSRREAARVALSIVREGWMECSRLPFADRLSWYTDGACRRSWWRSRSRVNRALSMLPPAPA
jgi:hypothetical protein